MTTSAQERNTPIASSSDEPRPNWHEDAFFGIHYDLHAGPSDTELGRELSVDHLVERLERVMPDWIQCDCKGHEGMTSWPTKVGYTSPGVVQDSLKIHREATRKLGIPLGMHYSGVWDTQAMEHHPDWARLDADGTPDHRDMGDWALSTSRLSGYTEEYMIPQLLEIMDTYDVDGFWVDGENWASKPDWREACQQEFTARTGITEIPRASGDAHWREWLDFHRDLFVEHVTAYANAVHERKPECLVVSNWMYTMRQPEAIAAPIDYISGDFDSKWGADRAAVEGRMLDGRDVSWDLMAWGFTKATPHHDAQPWILKSATQLAQEAAECVALGGAVMIYDTPQRTGWLTDWHQDTLAEVARFCRARKEICFKSDSRSQAAVIHSVADYYDKVNGTYAFATNNLPIEGALHIMLEQQISTDVMIDSAFLQHHDRYQLVILPERSKVSPDLHAALDAFVRNGGHLIVSGATCSTDYPDWVLATPEGDPIEPFTYVPVAQRAVGIKGPWQPVTPGEGTDVWVHAMTQQERTKDETDRAIVTHNALGKGSVTAIHGAIFEDYHSGHPPLTRAFMRSLVDRLGIAWEVEITGPPSLEVVTRTQGDHLAINLINRGAGETLSPHRPQFDELTPIERVLVQVRRDECPRRVSFEPSADPVTWSWQDGVVSIVVPSVRIHDIVVIA